MIAFSSYAALIISFIALWLSYRTSQRQIPLLELQIEKEKAEALSKTQADIRIFYHNKTSAKPKIRIVNVGQAEARNIKLSYAKNSGAPLLDSEANTKFPLDVLEPKSSVELVDVSDNQTPAKCIIRVEWEDDYRTVNSKDISLTR